MNDQTKQLAINRLEFSDDSGAMTVQQVLGQVALIQQIMQSAMIEGTHYGKIPGCGDKPTLLKPGAEKLCLTFRLAPTYDVQERLLDGGHREYTITCTLTSIISGHQIGQGVGFGSTMESKYRFRKGDAQPTDKPVPRAYWDVRADDPVKAQELIGGKGFSVKKVDGKGWMIATGGELTENTNPANETNTVLKMCKKRALVDAVLTATGASDIFNQDLEEIAANMAMYSAPTAQPAVHPIHNSISPNVTGGEGADSFESVESDSHLQMYAWMKEAGMSREDFTMFLRGQALLGPTVQLAQLTEKEVVGLLEDWSKIEGKFIKWKAALKKS